MNLNKVLATNNDCYKAGKTMVPKGIMVHSTGANNPKLSRYVSPDDGKLGTPSSAHWNVARPGGKGVCVHAFIGKLKDGSIATYQTLPWNMRGWHGGGKSNDSYIGFEICEDNLKDKKYFEAVYQEAIELCIHLCKKFNLTEKNIICHSEGYKMGIATNHADVMHWFPKHGKSMDTFRADVAKGLKRESQSVGRTGKVTASVLNVRSGPGASYKDIGDLKNGDVVEIFEEKDGWYKIVEEKWVSGKYISIQDRK